MRRRRPGDSLEPWLEGYLGYLAEVRRASPGTVKDVRCTLKRAVAVMGTIRPGRPLWKCALADFLAWLERSREQGRSPLTLNKELSHLRGLLDYSWRGGRTDRNVLDGLFVEDAKARRPARVLTEDEARRLLAACRQRSPRQKRERLMVLLLYGCGLRTSELCRLNVQDVDTERQELFVLGKGDRERRIPIPDGVWTELLAYLVSTKRKRGCLFRTEHKRRRITDNTVCDVVARAVRRAGIPGRVTARTLRHTFATHLMDRGVGLAVIASLMGHRSPSETGVYLHALPGKREAAVRNLPPCNGDEP